MLCLKLCIALQHILILFDGIDIDITECLDLSFQGTDLLLHLWHAKFRLCPKLLRRMIGQLILLPHIGGS